MEDYVPVRDQPNEAGIPGGEQPTAAASGVPEGKTRQEEHGAMRCFFQPQLKTVFTSTAQKCVHVYNVPTVSFSTLLIYTTPIVCYFVQNDKNNAVTFNKALYF